MRFLVDAQLPYGIKQYLNSLGHDVLHTDDLPQKERTPDKEINLISVKEKRIVITKDKDFLDSHILKKVPPKIVIVTTGNIKNKVLFNLFKRNANKLSQLLENHDLIELSTEGINGA